MGLTITEKILAHASHKRAVTAGEVAIADVDVVMTHDSTGPLAIETFYKIGKKVFDPNKVVIIFDHFFPPPKRRWMIHLRHCTPPRKKKRRSLWLKGDYLIPVT